MVAKRWFVIRIKIIPKNPDYFSSDKSETRKTSNKSTFIFSGDCKNTIQNTNFK